MKHEEFFCFLALLLCVCVLPLLAVGTSDDFIDQKNITT